MESESIYFVRPKPETNGLSANLLVPALQKVTINIGMVRDLTTTTWEEAVVNVKTCYMHV